MLRLINTLLIVFLFSYSHFGHCQNNNAVVEGLLFEDLLEDVIAQNEYVTDLFQDSNGFIWMGSFYGVNVYDGANFFFYKDHIDNNDGFKGFRVRKIIESHKGKILVAMRNSGVNVFNPSTGKFKNYYDEILKGAQSDLIIYIAENKNGDLYITTGKDIIIVKFDENENLVQHQIIKIDLNKKEYLRKGLFFNGNFLIETNQRILKLDQTSTHTLFEGYNIRKTVVIQDELWIRADQRIGTLNIKNKATKWLNYKLPKEEVYITDFHFAQEDLLFISTKKGCIRLDLNSDLDVIKSTKLHINESNTVEKIFSDKNNNLYFSVLGVNGGIKKLNINQLKNQYIALPPLNKDYVLHTFLNDSNSLYWSGSNDGIFAFNTKSGSFHQFSETSILGLEGAKIFDIVKVNNKVWLNTNKGIAKYNKQKNNFEIYKNLKGFKPNLVNKLCVYKSCLWFMTSKGIAKFDTVTNETSYFSVADISNFDISTNEKKYNDVFNIQEPSAINIVDNVLWVNIQTKGLFSYDISSGKPKATNRYREDFSMLFQISNYSPVRGINFDDLDRIWLSGINGIYVYDYQNREIIKHINKSNILDLDALYDLLKDEKGNFWVKQFNSPALNIDANSFEVIEKTPNWMYLPIKINERDNNSGPTYQDKFKQIFINGANGYIVYHPDKLEIDKAPPRVVLTNIEINGEAKYSNFIGSQELDISELQYDENSILLNLKSISHDNSPLKKFGYRLIGVSDEWTYTSSLEPLNYIGLQPNTYRLEVKSTNNGKAWSPIITLATFDILSPWWKTTFAYLIYLLLFIAIIYAFYKVQLNKKLAVSEANQLKQLDDFKNKFYQNITHEFRTPLTVIIGMAESLESKASKMIKRNSQQLLNLVNELLEIGKIESNSANLELSSRNIVAFTKYCMESLESLAKNKEITLKFSANPNSIQMEFDVDKVQLILNNLLSNAIKFTPKNGSVDVSVVAMDEIVEIKVSDSGTGILDENLEKIFDRYFQEKSNKSSTGSGLGLALSRELVQLMNGSIIAYNNKDNGACFVVSLPITKNILKPEDNLPNKDKYQVENIVENEENIILVIEDNKDVLTYISSVLEPYYKVYSAPNGKLGFDKAVELIPDLIISDVMMPVMDGYEACHLIKSDFRTNHIPVIMLTAKVDHDSKMSGLKLGADVYLGKPFNQEELLVQINNLISIRERLKKKYNSENSNLDNTQTPKISNEFLSKISEVLLDNISDDTFGINEICKEIGVSRTQLHRKLKALTGLSASKFIREIRLNEGYKLIKNTELSVSEIAYSIGFSDPNYFTKLFTEKFQVPPSKIDK